MDEVANLIIDTITKNESKLYGINFLINFLNDSYETRYIDGKNVKFYLVSKFKSNVIKCGRMPQAKAIWEKMNKDGDVSQAIITAFDWDSTPEGFEFWSDTNKSFTETYNRAKIRGLVPSDIMPTIINQEIIETIRSSRSETRQLESNYVKEDTPTNALPLVEPKEKTDTAYPQIGGKSKKDATEIKIMPSEVTLKLMNYLSPLVKHGINKQIDILLDVLKTYKCQNEFFTNLRIRPKRNGYEEKFWSFMRGEDMRGIIYWAFNWSSVPEGFNFWSKMSDLVQAAITKEYYITKPNYVIPAVPPQHRDPITHTTNVMAQQPTPYRRPPMYGCGGYESFDRHTHNEHPQVMGGEHIPSRFDDICEGYDGYYGHGVFYGDDYYGQQHGYQGYTGQGYHNRNIIPQDIIKMPITSSHIEIVIKETEETVASVAS